MGNTLGNLEGSRSPLLESSPRVRQPPCHVSSVSFGEKRSRTPLTTSSAIAISSLDVILPIPLAADHLTTVVLSLRHSRR